MSIAMRTSHLPVLAVEEDHYWYCEGAKRELLGCRGASEIRYQVLPYYYSAQLISTESLLVTSCTL